MEPSSQQGQLRQKARGCGLVILLLLAIVAGLFVGVFVVPSSIKYSEARKRLVQVLSSAQSDAERREAVKSLGTYLARADGTWIAIGYRDSHGIPGMYSCAIASCSDGTWFECSYHFCGVLAHFEHIDDTASELSDPAERNRFRQGSIAENETLSALEAARTSPSLPEAKGYLAKLGFVPMKPK